MDQEKIGRFLSKSRKKKSLTQEQLAEKLGVNSRTISRWETGRTMPDYSVLNDLCKELEISINELFAGEKITKEKLVEKCDNNMLLMLKDFKNSKNKNLIIIFILLGLFLFSFIFGVYKLFSSQYNLLNGLSYYMNITIDENKEREKIGNLDGYTIYTERLNIEDCYFRTISSKVVPLKEVIERKLISVKDLENKANAITKNGDIKILIFENYEIVLEYDSCIIRPYICE